MKIVNINCSRIDKSALYEGKNGKYLSLVLFDNRDGVDQYGNAGFVTQDIGKERRLAGERGPILGNWKESAQSRPAQDQGGDSRSVDDESDVPF
jgi:hypothetical protein